MAQAQRSSNRGGVSVSDQKKIRDILEPLTEGNHIFQTIHGSPLSIAQKAALEAKIGRGRPAHIGVVPEGIILMIITPPNAVVHTSPTEDTENVRFFSQRNFLKTGMARQGKAGWGGNGSLTTDGGCWGASIFVPSYQNERIITPEEQEELKEKEKKEQDKVIANGPISARVKARRQAAAEADEEAGSSDDEEEEEPRGPAFVPARRRNNGYDNRQNEPTVLPINEWALDRGDPDEVALLVKYLTTDRPYTQQPGFEILNNIQIFFPGELFYNQGQEFDDEADSADFDSYYTGAARQDYRWPDSSAGATGNVLNKLKDDPIPFGLGTLEGTTAAAHRADIFKTKRSGDGKKTVKKFDGGLVRTPYFNRKTCGLPYWQPRVGGDDQNDGVRLVANAQQTAGPTAGGWTTEDVLNGIATAEGKFKIVILNSCSPSLSVQRQKAIHMGLNTASRKLRKQLLQRQSMADNLNYRNQVYWNGRRNFCMLRKNLPWIGEESANPLLPVWSNHSQFTRIDMEDLHNTHIFIGDVFAREKQLRLQNAQYISQNININHPNLPIQFILNTANQQIRSQNGVYDLFPALYTTAALDRRGTLMKQLREQFINLYNEKIWDAYVNHWKQSPDTSPPISSHLAGLVGGKRKRRRRKRKTKRKRRKKTKKSRRRRKKRTRRRRRKR